MLFLLGLLFACLLFPPLIVVVLIFFGAWSRYDAWRERRRLESDRKQPLRPAGS